MKLDSVHFYVADAYKTSSWFIRLLGFQAIDYCQQNDAISIAIANSSILIIISSPLNNYGKVARYLTAHTEGIVDVTFRVSQLQLIVDKARRNKIHLLQPIQNSTGFKYACVAGWDCLQHTLIESSLPCSCYLLPNGKIRKLKTNRCSLKNAFEFTEVDHIVLNVARGQLTKAVKYYQTLFDFQIKQTFKIKTNRSGLYSRALCDREGKIQFNINEPSTANSQIQKFIDLNRGAGIQHLALRSNNLIKDVSKMRSLGVSFLSIPSFYYSQLKQKIEQDYIAFSQVELHSVIKQQILVDWHQKKSNSLLMQIFTQPILQKPTFFLEFIERRQQAVGFGEGNFHALFAAVEQHQLG